MSNIHWVLFVRSLKFKSNSYVVGAVGAPI